VGNQDADASATKVFIPYFGTVFVQPDRRFQKPSGSSPGPALFYQSINAATVPTPGSASNVTSDSSLSYPNMSSASDLSNRLEF
jgi:hypothetical protein